MEFINVMGAGTSLAPTTIVRRFGNLTLDNGNVTLYDKGWYLVIGFVTFTGTAGLATINVTQDGDAVTGGSSSLTAEASTTYTLPIAAMVRKSSCKCVPSSIALSSTGASTLTVSNVDLTVLKVGSHA